MLGVVGWPQVSSQQDRDGSCLAIEYFRSTYIPSGTAILYADIDRAFSHVKI